MIPGPNDNPLGSTLGSIAREEGEILCIPRIVTSAHDGTRQWLRLSGERRMIDLNSGVF
jgi:hypothetical protein